LCAGFNLDDTTVATVRNQAIYLYDLTNKKNTAKVSGDFSMVNIALSPDRKVLASAGYDEGVKIRDTTSLQEIATLAGPKSKGINCLAFGPGGKVLATAGSEGVINLWEVASRQNLAVLNGGKDESIQCLSLSPDGRLLATGSKKQVLLWDISASKNIARFEAKFDPAKDVLFNINSLSFSPDSKTLAVGAGGQTALLVLLDVPGAE